MRYIPEFTNLLENFKIFDGTEFTTNLSELYYKLDKKQNFENELDLVLHDFYKSGQVSKYIN